jgi:hypothetical protein
MVLLVPTGVVSHPEKRGAFVDRSALSPDKQSSRAKPHRGHGSPRCSIREKRELFRTILPIAPFPRRVATFKRSCCHEGETLTREWYFSCRQASSHTPRNGVPLWIGQLFRLTNSHPERNLTGVMGALGVPLGRKENSSGLSCRLHHSHAVSPRLRDRVATIPHSSWVLEY